MSEHGCVMMLEMYSSVHREVELDIISTKKRKAVFVIQCFNRSLKVKRILLILFQMWLLFRNIIPLAFNYLPCTTLRVPAQQCGK